MPSAEFPQSEEKKEVIKSCAIEHNWTVQLPEYDRVNPSFDLASTMEAISKSDLVLVDLSNERPSCYFELGLAESLGANVVALAIEGTPIHQTSNRVSVIFFANIPEFRHRVEQCLSG